MEKLEELFKNRALFTAKELILKIFSSGTVGKISK